jgi:hypothetical protein
MGHAHSTSSVQADKTRVFLIDLGTCMELGYMAAAPGTIMQGNVQFASYSYIAKTRGYSRADDLEALALVLAHAVGFKLPWGAGASVLPNSGPSQCPHSYHTLLPRRSNHVSVSQRVSADVGEALLAKKKAFPGAYLDGSAGALPHFPAPIVRIPAPLCTAPKMIPTRPATVRAVGRQLTAFLAEVRRQGLASPVPNYAKLRKMLGALAE